MTQQESVRVEIPGRSASGYDVVIERGGIGRIGELCERHLSAQAYALISDSRVAELYGQRALEGLRTTGRRADAFIFTAGEWNKTRQSWSELSDAMLAEGFGRDAAVVALGGGVTGDLAGFVASTFKRGVPVVQVPTTVLAMVDSSVGGKTGVDTQEAKNAIGTFHHPSLVLVDPELLTTLAPFQRVAGLAESVKMAAMRDAELFDWIMSVSSGLRGGDLDRLTELVERSIRLKAEVISADPEERGLRAILNFGHTAGHALESLSGYSILHGEAVAQGMRLESRMGEQLGLSEKGTAARLDAALGACGLPLEVNSGFPAESILDAARSDKKARAGILRWSVPSRIGSPARSPDDGYTHAIERSECIAALDSALRTASEVPDSEA
ncbi:MAG: 3-dehydroquinate synthase [Gemmatimonadota bacterium]|jgi:3-dehydroquinate synthase